MSRHNPKSLTGWPAVWRDVRSLARRTPGLLREDPAAAMLVGANVVPVVQMAVTGEPVASILIDYWLQMMIIGFWTAAKLVVIARWAALAVVPMFLVMYLSVTNFFGGIAAILLDEQLKGSGGEGEFSLWKFAVPALVFFATHGWSFYANFVRGREYENRKWDEQMGQPFLRVMPMWLATVFGSIVFGMLGVPVLIVVVVVPTKLALDLLGHFATHGKLFEDDVEPAVG